MKLDYQHIESNKIQGFEGVSYDMTEIDTIFPTDVKNILFDTEGTVQLVNEFSNLESVKTTGFNTNILVNVFSLQDSFLEHPSWRIGEAFAELHLEKNHKVKFYYSELRDARNPRGNKTGADLIGFIDNNDETVFLFGEVKTSDDASSPPQVLYGRTGMIEQLRDFGNKIKQGELIRYLGFKVVNLDHTNLFRIAYTNALASYINSNGKKLFIYGVLVRDTKSNIRDIEPRYQSLVNGLCMETGLKLVALYIPLKLSEWNKKVSQQ